MRVHRPQGLHRKRPSRTRSRKKPHAKAFKPTLYLRPSEAASLKKDIEEVVQQMYDRSVNEDTTLDAVPVGADVAPMPETNNG